MGLQRNLGFLHQDVLLLLNVCSERISFDLCDPKVFVSLNTVFLNVWPVMGLIWIRGLGR